MCGHEANTERDQQSWSGVVRKLGRGQRAVCGILGDTLVGLAVPGAMDVNLVAGSGERRKKIEPLSVWAAQSRLGYWRAF